MFNKNTAENNINTSICYDLLIIGGGINGAGIAADAAGRGLSVMLCEQNDLGSATSSASTKLIHGGLRYLEYFEFRLVKEALHEREVLLKKAPHLIHPLQFIMPHDQLLRPAWMIHLGLLFYDHLGGRKLLPPSKSIHLSSHPAGKVLKTHYQKGFVYSDCWTDDARLVILNAMQAQQRSAVILPRTRFINAKQEHNQWLCELENSNTEEKFFVRSHILINATGPWVDQILKGMKIPSKHHISLVKGSHIVIPKFYDHNFAYTLQNEDKRVIFVIPYLEDYCLIGTTEQHYTGDLSQPHIKEEEKNYLCKAVNRYFNKTIHPSDIKWSYSGIRPLQSDEAKNPSAITRDYSLELDSSQGAPLLSIFGGKITTYRKLAEHALSIVKPFLAHTGDNWTSQQPLPGGDIPNANFNSFLHELNQQYPWLPTTQIERYAKNYGTLTHQLLSNKKSLQDLGKHFGADLYECEIEYLKRHEWAQTAEDILWRRTKLGLKLTQNEQQLLHAYMEQYGKVV